MVTQIKNQESKDFRTKTIPSYALIILGIIFIVVSYFQQRKTNTILENMESEATKGGNVAENITIDLGTGDNNLTGNIEEEPTEEEKYINLKNAGNYRSFYPATQGRTNGDYATNSNFMVNYLTKNTFQFSLPKKPTNGYLYIRLLKATPNSIFAYRYNSKINGYTISGDLDKKNSLINSDTEMLFKLDNISYIPYNQNGIKTFDWLSILKEGNQNFIAGFVRDYDGSNKIQEITIVWE